MSALDSRFWIVVVIANKFFGCANHWKVNAVSGKASSDSLANVRIRDVFAVPGEEELHSVNSRRSDVNGIPRCDGRQNRFLHKFVCQICHLLADVEQRDADQKTQALLGHDSVSVCCLFEDDLGRVKIVSRTMKIPPLACQFLAGKLDDVSGRSRDVIAWDGGFDEYGVWHSCSVSRRRFSPTTSSSATAEHGAAPPRWSEEWAYGLRQLNGGKRPSVLSTCGPWQRCYFLA